MLVLFQEQFLKYMPVSLDVYHYLRQLPDVLVVLGLIVALKSSSVRNSIGSSSHLKTITVLLIVFLVYSFIVSLVASPPANLLFELLNIKALLRYSLLIFIIRSFEYTERDLSSFVNFIYVLFFIQICIGLFQLLGGIQVRDILASRHMLDGFVGAAQGNSRSNFKDVNHLVGTMGDNISYGYFIILCVAVYLSRDKKLDVFAWFVVATAAGLLFYSGSRAVLILLPVLVLYKLSLKNQSVNSFKLILVSAIFVFPLVVGVVILGRQLGGENNLAFGFIFTSDYFYVAMNQRLGIVLDLLPKVIVDANLLLGFGPDKYNFSDYAATAYRYANPILVGYLPHILEDVYWVAVLIYYGPIGLLIWISVLIVIIRRSLLVSTKSSSEVERRLARIVLMFCVIAIAGGFVNPVFEIRSFSIFFWLFTGLIFSSRSRDIRAERVTRRR
mgnify:CR=1 FL=1